MRVQADVIESITRKSKAGKDYTIAIVRIEGRVGKIFSDFPLEVADDQTVDLQLSPNTEMFITPRITHS